MQSIFSINQLPSGYKSLTSEIFSPNYVTVELHEVSQENTLSASEIATKNKRIVLNARGVKYEILRNKFNKFPDHSRLGRLKYYDQMKDSHYIDLTLFCDEFNSYEAYDEFYFDRDPEVLRYVLNFYSTNRFHLDSTICALYLEEELHYWQIDPNQIELCCKLKYESKREDIVEEIKFDKEIVTLYNQGQHVIEFSSKFYFHKIREKLWNIIEKPQSSKAAFAYFLFSNLISLTWVTCLVISTLPQFRNHIEDLAEEDPNVEKSYAEYLELIFSTINLISFSFFATELFFRFLISPKKRKFFRSLLNMIDALTILLFFTIFFIWEIIIDNKTAFIALRIAESLRMIMLLKMTRISKKFQVLGMTIKRSYMELFLLLFYFLTSVLIISSVIFHLEVDDNSKFDSIPATFWWAVVTMTTVGYGDMVPESVFGKIFTSVASIWGILLVSLPIAVIGSNFNHFYNLFNKEKVKRNLERTIPAVAVRNHLRFRASAS